MCFELINFGNNEDFFKLNKIMTFKFQQCNDVTFLSYYIFLFHQVPIWFKKIIT